MKSKNTRYKGNASAGVKYEFEIYRSRTERSASRDVRVLLHRTWITEQSDPLDLCDTLVGRTSGEPSVHPKDHLVRSTG